MANRKNPKSPRSKEGKSSAAESRSGRSSEETVGGAKFYTWFMVVALLGVWTSLAIVYFDIIDYESVLGKLSSYDSDGDGDFDVDDAKILLGVGQPSREEPAGGRTVFSDRVSQSTNQQSTGSQSDSTKSAGAEWPALAEEDFVPDSGSSEGADDDTIDTTGVLVEEPSPQESAAVSGQYQTSSKLTEEAESEPESAVESGGLPQEPPEQQSDPKLKVKAAKKKKPKLLNKIDKTIRAEIEVADKLRKKGHLQEALQEFETLVHKYPQSPRARFGQAQSEDDLAERLRSNDFLLRAINSYREAAELPDVTSDLLRAALKRRAERQQFLGNNDVCSGDPSSSGSCQGCGFDSCGHSKPGRPVYTAPG